MKRDDEFAARYRAGETLQQIADAHGITRERVRQCLKRAGVKRQEGGRSVRPSQRVLAMERKRQSGAQKYIKRYGFPREVLDALVDERFSGSRQWKAFRDQRRKAAERGIGWKLTFPEWWDLWRDRWPERGRFSGQYVMARFGDVGAYELGNVEVITSDRNIRDVRERERANGKRFFVKTLNL